MNGLILPRRLLEGRQFASPRRQRGFIINPYVFGGGGSWVTEALWTSTAASPGWSGYTMRQLFPVLTVSGTKVRLTMGPHASEAIAVGAFYVGKRAGAGDAYDFAATPVQGQVGGSNSYSTTADVVSDEIALVTTAGDQLIVSVYFSGASSVASAGAGPLGYANYNKNANDPSTVDATGYATTGAPRGLIKKLEIWVP